MKPRESPEGCDRRGSIVGGLKGSAMKKDLYQVVMLALSVTRTVIAVIVALR